jgi:twitching motility protein PilI
MARAAKLDLRTFQKELATRLATKTAAQVESSRLGLACGGERWLIRLSDAGEVVTLPEIIPVPLTLPWYVGIANIRGNLYSVIDFARFLARDSALVGGASRLVVFGARAGGINAGIVVQQVLGLRNIADTDRATRGCAGVVCPALDGRGRPCVAGDRPRKISPGSRISAGRDLGSTGQRRTREWR